MRTATVQLRTNSTSGYTSIKMPMTLIDRIKVIHGLDDARGTTKAAFRLAFDPTGEISDADLITKIDEYAAEMGLRRMPAAQMYISNYVGRMEAKQAMRRILDSMQTIDAGLEVAKRLGGDDAEIARGIEAAAAQREMIEAIRDRMEF